MARKLGPARQPSALLAASRRGTGSRPGRSPPPAERYARATNSPHQKLGGRCQRALLARLGARVTPLGLRRGRRDRALRRRVRSRRRAALASCPLTCGAPSCPPNVRPCERNHGHHEAEAGADTAAHLGPDAAASNTVKRRAPSKTGQLRDLCCYCGTGPPSRGRRLAAWRGWAGVWH